MKTLERGRRCAHRAEPTIEPSSAPEALRGWAPTTPPVELSNSETYCNYFNQEGAVPWQPST